MIVTGALALVLFSAYFVGLSAWGAVYPSRLISFVRRSINKGGIVSAVGFRLLLAVLLWVTAPVSHTPTIFPVLAALMLAAAILVALMGTELALKFIDHLTSWPNIVIRLPCFLGVAFGIFLIWSVSPVWAAI